MSTKISGIIDKVQKLLALSQSSNANEAAVAASVANKLIDQYRLSEADLSSEEDDPLIEDDGFIYVTGRIVPWKRYLVTNLACHYGCAIFNRIIGNSKTNRKISNYKLIGRKSDIQLTRYMFSWLSMECIRLSEKEAYGKGRVFVASYCQGFVTGVKQQLSHSRNEAKQNATSASIIKIDAREQEANQLMNKLHNLTNVKNLSASKMDPRAFDAGMNRGKNIHLGSAISEGSGIKMLGH